MIRVTRTISLDERDVTFDAIRASGPGGQNVNKVSTAVQLRFNLARTESLPDVVKLRLQRIAKNRITNEGELIIEAKRYRSQIRNREDAINRLVDLVRRAAAQPRVRKKTKPSRGARERRLKAKRIRSEIKRSRSRDEQ